jgi:hypothetical protein
MGYPQATSKLFERARMLPASRLLVASLLASTTSAAAAAPKPSIIHVIADDLGFNDIWRYNAADGTVESNPYTFTPNIERIIESGIALTAYRRPHPTPCSWQPQAGPPPSLLCGPPRQLTAPRGRQTRTRSAPPRAPP